VTAGLPYHVCRSCGLAVFPPRALCPRCGGATWEQRVAAEATVEDTTSVRRFPGSVPDEPIHLATVRLDAGPAVIVRMHGAAGPGARVALKMVGSAPHAREAS